MVRWSIAFLTSTSVLAALYHFGTRRREHWFWVGPGAVAGTLIWFPATLAFGWYVTRIANYSLFYGSFGAGICCQGRILSSTPASYIISRPAKNVAYPADVSGHDGPPSR